MAVSSSAPVALLIIATLIIVLTNVRVKTEGAHERDHGSSEYCIVGGGPGGLQVALEMDYEAMDYAVFEREPRAGSFFEKLPRFDRLISINKRHFPSSVPGGRNGTFAFRHDWNSLLIRQRRDVESNPSLSRHELPRPRPPESAARFTSWDDSYYPSARTLARYLQHVAGTELDASRVHYNATVVRVSRGVIDDSAEETTTQSMSSFTLSIAHSDGRSSMRWSCKRGLVWATNFGTANNGGESLVGDGWKHAIAYEDAPEDPDYYKDKNVLIVGGGNAAYEVARAIANVAARVSVWSRRAPRLSWQSHYPGDVRGSNTLLFDQYQLKTLDQLLISISPRSRLALETVWPCLRRNDGNGDRNGDDDDVEEEEEEEEDLLAENDAFVQDSLKELALAGSRAARRGLADWSAALRRRDEENVPDVCQDDGDDEAETTGRSRRGRLPRRFEVSEEAREDDFESVMRSVLARREDHRDGASANVHLAEDIDMRYLGPRTALERYRSAYDIVVTAMGWKWGDRELGIFDDDVLPELAEIPKYPKLQRDGYASSNVAGLSFAGSLAHSHDWRRSSGGFIHGFRYSARALVRQLREDDGDDSTAGWLSSFVEHGDLFLSEDARDNVVDALLLRMRESDGLYQLFSELAFVLRIEVDERTGTARATGFDEVPVRRMLARRAVGGAQTTAFISLTFEYGRYFHGERVLLAQGHTGEFIQPVLRVYNLRGLQDADGTRGCASHGQCSGCSGRCSRFTRTCVCTSVPEPLKGTRYTHWEPLHHAGQMADTGHEQENPQASTHPLDEFSEVMPDLTVLMGESEDTEWSLLKHRLRAECFVDAAVSIVKDNTPPVKLSLPLMNGSGECPGTLLRESRALFRSVEALEAEDRSIRTDGPDEDGPNGDEL